MSSRVVRQLAEILHDEDVTNSELGVYLLALFVAEKALSRPSAIEHSNGRSTVKDKFVQSVIAAIHGANAISAESTAIETALKKAAIGDYTTAGRLLREHMMSGARTVKAANTEARRKTARRRAGGQKSVAKQRERNIKRDADVIQKYDYLISKGWKPRDIPTHLSTKFVLDRSTILRILKKAGKR